MPGEDDLIAWLRRRSIAGGRGLIGDDAAVLPENESWAVTMDSQIEGTHFLPGLDPATLAKRLVAVNLSDLAAMGARPVYAFLALAAPATFDHRRFLKALLRTVRRYDLELAGGDLATSSHVTAVLTLLGQKSHGGRWLRRNAARSGESLWLGGSVGEAAIGAVLVRGGAVLDSGKVRLPEDFVGPPAVCAAARRAVKRHLLPQPQLRLGRWLAHQDCGGVIDVSDGLALDLHRLCRESSVGAEVDLDRLPLPRNFRRLCDRLGRSWRNLALSGGEDYVLLFTLPAGLEPAADLDCCQVGRTVPGRRVHVLHRGEKTVLPPSGWDHLVSRS